MEHNVFGHVGPILAIAVNLVGLGALLWKGAQAMGIFSESLKSLGNTMGELKEEVSGLRGDLIDQGKQIVRLEAYSGPERRERPRE